MKIDNIVIGERSRSSLTKLDSLAASIERVGIIQPPVVREVDGQFQLVCGHRRIEAAKSLGWTDIRVTVAHDLGDELAALLAEGEENTEREPFTVAEAVEHRRRIRDVESALAKDRQGTRTDLKPSSKLDEGSTPKERTTRARTAKATGYGATTLDKAEAIVEAAKNPETPEPVRLVAQESVANLAQHGVKVDAEKRRLEDALARHLVGDDQLSAAKYRASLTKEIARMSITTFEVERVIEVADDGTFLAIDTAFEKFARWHADLSTRRKGLRVLKGGAL